MPDQRLDPKRERWINVGFVLLTVAIAVVLLVIAAKLALDQNEGGVEKINQARPSTPGQQLREP